MISLCSHVSLKAKHLCYPQCKSVLIHTVVTWVMYLYVTVYYITEAGHVWESLWTEKIKSEGGLGSNLTYVCVTVWYSTEAILLFSIFVIWNPSVESQSEVYKQKKFEVTLLWREHRVFVQYGIWQGKLKQIICCLFIFFFICRTC